MSKENPTLGEYRVGISFNPSNDPLVDQIKRAQADFIDQCAVVMAKANSGGNREAGRCAAEAMTCAEDAAMWAVKAVTKPDMPVELQGRKA